MIEITPADLETVKRILAGQAPDREVWAFGSRVHGRGLKTFSDLDLAVMGESPLELSCLAALRDAFSESDLPFKVDIVEWSTTNKVFRKIIQDEHEVIVANRAPATRRTPVVACLVLALMCVAGAVGKASAQTLVVAPCRDESSSELGKNAQQVVVKALGDQGAKLIDYKDYMQEVARLAMGKQNALTRWGMQKVAAGLKIDGILTSSALLQGKKYLIAFFLFGADGKLVVKKAYRLAKPSLPMKTARKLSELVIAKLGPKVAKAPAAETEENEALALVPLAAVESEPPKTPPPETPPPPKLSPQSEKDQQQWKGLLKQAEENPQEDASESSDEKPLVVEQEGPPEMRETNPAASARVSRAPRKPTKPTGSLPEILIAAGMSINTRAGLSPRHEAGAYPGIRIDGRVFLGSLLDTVVLRDIGFEGMFTKSIGLAAEPELLDESWDASQMRWNVGLVYRLAFDRLPLAPAFVLRLGYGATSYTIDHDHPELIDAGYTYTSGVLEIDLSLVGSWLVAQLSGGYLFSVWPTDELSGDGSGFLLSAGLRTELFGGLSLGLGYEQLQFFINDRSLGQTSDRFQQFYLRAGWFQR